MKALLFLTQLFSLVFNPAFAEMPAQKQMANKLWREMNSAVKIKDADDEDLTALKEDLKKDYSDEISLSQAAIKKRELPSNELKKTDDSKYFQKSKYKKARSRSR